MHRSEVPKGANIVPSKLVFKIKMDPDNNFIKCKARLVYRGDLARIEQEYWSTSSSMMSALSFKTMLSLSTSEWGLAVENEMRQGATRDEALKNCECMKLHSVDVTQAYIRAPFPPGHPDLYMELPSLDPQQAKSEYVAAMRKMLYGHPSSGRVFEKFLDRFIREAFNARPLVGDRNMYRIYLYRDDDGRLTHHRPHRSSGGADETAAYIQCGSFVDDVGFWATTQEAIDYFNDQFAKRFGEDGVTGGGLAETMLGLKIHYNDDELSSEMTMPGFIDAISERFENNFDAPIPSTPLPVNHVDKKHEGEVDPARRKLFQQMVGCLTWATHQAKPEAMIASSILASHNQNPGEEHIKLARQAIRYLRGTKDRGIKFHGSSEVLDREYPRRNKLDCMVDANLGADAHSEHSRSCYVIMLNGGVIKMKIMKQTRVSRSTGHAECQALVLLTQSIQLCRDMLTELGYSQGSVRICEDNAAVTMQAGGDSQGARSGHYRRDQAAIDEVVNAGKIFVDKIPSAENTSDVGTKAIKPAELFQYLRDKMTGYNDAVDITPTVQKAIDATPVTKKPRCAKFLGSTILGSESAAHGTNAAKKGATKSRTDPRQEQNESGTLMQTAKNRNI